jgi:hypothetical protein
VSACRAGGGGCVSAKELGKVRRLAYIIEVTRNRFVSDVCPWGFAAEVLAGGNFALGVLY